MFENHGQDGRCTGPLDVAPTVSALYGTGGNNTPLVCWPSTASTLTAEGADASPCVDRGQNIVVTYDCRGNGDGKTVSTLTGDHENRVTDYTSVICMATSRANAEISDTVCPTILHNDDHPILCMAHGQANAEIAKNLSPTLGCNHEQPIITQKSKPPRRYIVRRLTPLECCRLQGFPDGWCENLGSENPTEEEVERWQRIFAAIDSSKKRTRKQIEKWLRKPGSDSAAYKAFGNSVAVPCVFFVLDGIARALEEEGCN